MDRRNIIPTVFWYDIGSAMDWRLTRDGIPVVFADGCKVTEEMEQFAHFLRREGFDVEARTGRMDPCARRPSGLSRA